MSNYNSFFRKFFKTFDLFPNTQFFRYNGDPQYTSATGGVISILIIAIFITLFASMGIQTAQKMIIFSSQSYQFQQNPSQLTLTTSPQGGFMFSIVIFGLDLSNTTNRIFDIKMYQEYYSPFMQVINSSQVPLVPCTQQHLNFTDEIRKMYSTLHFFHKLCPQLGHKFDLRGKFTSDISSQIKITIERCNHTLDATCMSDADYAALQATKKQFSMGIPIINTLINPQNQVYRNFYLEDRNRFLFSKTLGTNIVGDIKEDVIENDVSIMPYKDIQIEPIVRITDRFSYESYIPGIGQPLVSILLRKSLEKTTIKRSFNKVDTFFSYVGGLIGTIIGFIFIMEKYNQKAYEISIAHNLFRDNNGKEIPYRSFNICSYILIQIKNFFNFIKCNLNWKQTQNYIQCGQEIAMQLDVTYIMRKLMFFDAAMEKLLEKHQIQALCTGKKPSLDRVKKKRKTHFANEMIKKKLKNDELQRQNKIGQQNYSTSDHCPTNLPMFKQSLGLDINECQKQAKQSQQNQGVSSIDVSIDEQQLDQIHKSVKIVAKQSLSGKAISRKIIKQINSYVLPQIKRKVQFQTNKYEFADIRIQSLDSQVNSQTDDKLKRSGSGQSFDYNIGTK